MSAARRLPAYGRAILKMRRTGRVPLHITVVALDDWRLGCWFPRIVVPKNTDATQLDFSMLAALDVTLAWRPCITSVDRRDAVIREVMKIGPASLRAFDLENRDVLWVRSRALGLEREEYAQ